MAHYALLDDNNIVVQVITGKDEGGETNWEEYYSNSTGKTCKRTSYNSRGGEHSMPDCECFRKNYAGIDYYYDESKDAFIPPKPYNSWVLNENTCTWNAPIPMPTDSVYYWDENISNWVSYDGF